MTFLDFINGFNNREKLIGVLLIILLIFIFWGQKTRISALNMIRIVFSGIIFKMLLLMILYFLFLLFVLYKVNVWDIGYINLTIIWFVFSGCVTFFEITKYSQNPHLFKKLLLSSLGLSALLLFITSIFSFSLWIEGVLLIVVIFLSFLSAGYRYLEKYKNERIAGIIDGIITIIGVVILVLSVKYIILNYENYFTKRTLFEFFLPIIFTIGSIPFIYGLSLFAAYEYLFNRIKGTNRNIDKNVLFQTYKQIIIYAHINLSRISYLSNKSGLRNLEDKDFTKEKINQIKNQTNRHL